MLIGGRRPAVGLEKWRLFERLSGRSVIRIFVLNFPPTVSPLKNLVYTESAAAATSSNDMPSSYFVPKRDLASLRQTYYRIPNQFRCMHFFE